MNHNDQGQRNQQEHEVREEGNHKEHEDHKEEHQNGGAAYKPLPQQTERVIREIIGGAIAVHKALGPCRHQLDLIVEDCVIVEVKAVRRLRRIHQAQILSYQKATGCRVGLLMNFNVRMLVEGLQRFIR